MKKIVVGSIIAGILGLTILGIAYGVADRTGSATQDSARVVDAFHAALTRGDTGAALALLAEDAVIFESGGVERGKAEYAALHLDADAAFSREVPSRMTRRTAAADGTTAWLLTEGRSTGIYRNRPIDRRTTETAMLRRVSGSWRITHFHWSSAPVEAGK